MSAPLSALRQVDPSMAATLRRRYDSLLGDGYNRDFLSVLKRAASALDTPDCAGSGDPANCPENEGHGCCKPNPLSSGDAIACISMALQNPPDIAEWAQLLRDARYVIEQLEGERAKHHETSGALPGLTLQLVGIIEDAGIGHSVCSLALDELKRQGHPYTRPAVKTSAATMTRADRVRAEFAPG